MKVEHTHTHTHPSDHVHTHSSPSMQTLIDPVAAKKPAEIADVRKLLPRGICPRPNKPTPLNRTHTNTHASIILLQQLRRQQDSNLVRVLSEEEEAGEQADSRRC